MIGQLLPASKFTVGFSPINTYLLLLSFMEIHLISSVEALLILK